METKQDLDNILSRDWLSKFASSMVPRGMELNQEFIRVLYDKTQEAIFDKLFTEVKGNSGIFSNMLVDKLSVRRDSMAIVRADLDHEHYWTESVVGLEGLDKDTRMHLHRRQQ